jgi:hypothetical protein
MKEGDPSEDTFRTTLHTSFFRDHAKACISLRRKSFVTTEQQQQ